MDTNIEQKVLDLNNDGKSLRQIADDLGINKNKVSRILSKFLNPIDTAAKKSAAKAVEADEVMEVEYEETDERVSSFVGWDRIGPNEYSNKATGEIMNVRFVKGAAENHFIGHFVKSK